MSNSTALAPFEPTTLSEAVQLSETISKASLLPVALRNKPADVLISIMAGRELGLSPMQSLRSMHVVQGKPVMSADLMVALCVRRQEICEYFQIVESTAEVATYETKRKGHRSPTRISFTWADAQRAGLSGKDNWKNYPNAMLRARCAAALSRAVYPDLLAGVYEQGEVGSPMGGPIDVPTIEAEIVPETPQSNGHAANGHPPADPVLAKITAATTQAELDALVAECAALSNGAREAARAAWSQRAAEIA